MRCREIGTFLHCWWKCKNGAATLEDNLAVPQEVKHSYHVTQQVYSLGYILK